MRKFIALLCTLCLVSSLCSVPVSAAVVNPYFRIWEVSISETGTRTGTSHSFQTLKDAYNYSNNGDVIGEIRDKNFSTDLPLTITKNVVITSEYNRLMQDHASFHSAMTYTGTSAPFLTVANGGKLTLSSMTLTGNTNDVQQKGGLVRVEAGGTLRIAVDPYSGSTVILQNSKLTGAGSKGGALYVENGATVIIEGVSFKGNSAKSGANYYFENGATVIWDMNGDTTFDVRDLVRQKRHFADSSVSVSGTADCNSDRVLNAADLLIFKRFLLED